MLDCRKEFARTAHGMKSLAAAVLKQAFEDASRTPRKKTYNCSSQVITGAEIDAARSFILGTSAAWKDSLDFYCDMAELDSSYIIRLAKQQPWFKQLQSESEVKSNASKKDSGKRKGIK